MQTKNLERLHALLLLCLLSPLTASAWVTPVGISNQRSNHQRYDHNVAIKMLPVEAAEVIGEAIIEAVESLNNPEDEAAVLTDLAGVSSDLGVLFASETFILRFSTVVGKIFDLISDYLPDKSIRSDQLVLNIPLLAIAVYLFSRSAVPILKAQYVELDELDYTAFELCFEPVGVTLLQYKSMKATGCFEWITRDAGTVLIDENDYVDISAEVDVAGDNDSSNLPHDWKYLYWQYGGVVNRTYKGVDIGTVERNIGKHIDNPDAQGLLGDLRFLYNLDLERQRQQMNTHNGRKYGNDYLNMNPVVPIVTTTVASNGTRLLRIDSHKLFDLMDTDERLESAIRLLLLKGVQLKIGYMLNIIREKNDSASIEARGTLPTEAQPQVEPSLMNNGDQ